MHQSRMNVIFIFMEYVTFDCIFYVLLLTLFIWPVLYGTINIISSETALDTQNLVVEMY